MFLEKCVIGEHTEDAGFLLQHPRMHWKHLQFNKTLTNVQT